MPDSPTGKRKSDEISSSDTDVSQTNISDTRSQTYLITGDEKANLKAAADATALTNQNFLQQNSSWQLPPTAPDHEFSDEEMKIQTKVTAYLLSLKHDLYKSAELCFSEASSPEKKTLTKNANENAKCAFKQLLTLTTSDLVGVVSRMNVLLDPIIKREECEEGRASLSEKLADLNTVISIVNKNYLSQLDKQIANIEELFTCCITTMKKST